MYFNRVEVRQVTEKRVSAAADVLGGGD